MLVVAFDIVTYSRLITKLGDESFHTWAVNRVLPSAVAFATCRAIATQHTSKHAGSDGKKRLIFSSLHCCTFYNHH